MNVSRILISTALVFSLAMPAYAKKTPAASYRQVTLTTLAGGKGTTKDTFLINPWGMAFAPGTAIWIADNNAGVTSLYRPNGKIFKQLPFVTIPTPAAVAGPSAPTGAIVNLKSTLFGSNAPEFGDAAFLFATENGTVAAWNESDGTQATLAIDNSASGAVYKGLVIADDGTGDRLYLTNFSQGTIEVYDTGFHPVKETGSFADAAIPNTFSPFGIVAINGNLWVTYAIPNAARTDEINGPGNGFVDIFTPEGTLLSHFAANGSLNSPWGIALAPSNFGTLSNDVLVGNFGDGKINAYDLNGHFISTLNDKTGNPIVNLGLWALNFGDGVVGKTNELFFTAGGTDQNTGSFGALSPMSPASSGVGGVGSPY